MGLENFSDCNGWLSSTSMLVVGKNKRLITGTKDQENGTNNIHTIEKEQSAMQ